MKKLILFSILLSQFTSASAGNLSALFSYCAFNVPNDAPYVEFYLHVVGTTVKFVQTDGNMKKGQIEVQWNIKDNDRVMFFDKYNLNSPTISFSDSVIPDFIDQQRIRLNAGNYQMELSIKDKNSDAAAVTLKQQFNISFPADSVSLSDIELLETFTKAETQGRLSKSGYDLVPSVNSFFPKKSTELKFYAEVYRTDRVPADEYLVRYFISRYDNNKILPNYSFNLRQKPAVTNVIMGNIPITDLQSGNYNLTVEVINKKNELIAKKQVMFQRSNPQTKSQLTADMNNVNINNTFASMIEPDSMHEHLSCLYPISTNVETDVANMLMNDHDIPAMQKFLYYFWQKRNPLNPEEAWRLYMLEVEKVNSSFWAMDKKGYETDRGRVYLQYGPPNIVSDSKNDPTALPYEIWQYYKMQDNQTNRKFVFYEKELSTHDFVLIHSNAIGEIQEPKWETIIHDGVPGVATDPVNTPKMFGSDANDKFANPH